MRIPRGVLGQGLHRAAATSSALHPIFANGQSWDWAAMGRVSSAQRDPGFLWGGLGSPGSGEAQEWVRSAVQIWGQPWSPDFLTDPEIPSAGPRCPFWAPSVLSPDPHRHCSCLGPIQTIGFTQGRVLGEGCEPRHGDRGYFKGGLHHSLPHSLPHGCHPLSPKTHTREQLPWRVIGLMGLG